MKNIPTILLFFAFIFLQNAQGSSTPVESEEEVENLTPEDKQEALKHASGGSFASSLSASFISLVQPLFVSPETAEVKECAEKLYSALIDGQQEDLGRIVEDYSYNGSQKTLLQQGIIFKDERGSCSIHYAARLNQESSLKLLLESAPEQVDILDGEKMCAAYRVFSNIKKTDNPDYFTKKMGIAKILFLAGASLDTINGEAKKVSDVVAEAVAAKHSKADELTKFIQSVAAGRLKKEVQEKAKAMKEFFHDNEMN